MSDDTPRRQFRPGFRIEPNSRQFRPGFHLEAKDRGDVTEDSGSFKMTQTIYRDAVAEKETVPLPALPRVLEHVTSPLLPHQFVSPVLAELLPERSFAPTGLLTPRFGSKRWGKWVLVMLIVIGVLLALISGSFWLSSRANADVTLFQVHAQRTAPVAGGGGIVYPRQQLNMTYPVAERVLAVLVHVGDQVVPDQALLRLDMTQLDAQVKQAANNVTAAQDYLSTVSLSGNAVTIAQAQQQLTLARNRYTTLLVQSAYPFMRAGNLISPLRGVVTGINVSAGEAFTPTTVLLVIMDESALVVHMQVPLENVGQIQVGARAEVIPSALANRSFSGVVSAVIPRANPQTDTFEVWVNINDPQHLLLPGMSAFVRILLPPKAVIAVPRLSILTLANLTTVFVVREQHAYLRLVQVVGRYEDHLLVSAGLRSGEYVVLVGLDRLNDGQAVHVRAIEHAGGTL